MTLNLVNITMTMVIITTMVFRIPSLLSIIGLLLRRVVLKLLLRRRVVLKLLLLRRRVVLGLLRRRRVVLKLLRRRVKLGLLRVVSRLLRAV